MGVVKIKLKKNCSLSKYGYALDASAVKRHTALALAVREYGSSYVIKKLNVLAIYRKNNPKMKAQLEVIRQDIAHVQRRRNTMSQANRAQNLKTTSEKKKQKNKNNTTRNSSHLQPC